MSQRLPLRQRAPSLKVAHYGGRKICRCQLVGLDAKRLRMMAEMFQEQLEDENAIIEMLVESKNKTVDNVIKMMNAAFGTSQKIMAAGMAK